MASTSSEAARLTTSTTANRMRNTLSSVAAVADLHRDLVLNRKEARACQRKRAGVSRVCSCLCLGADLVGVRMEWRLRRGERSASHNEHVSRRPHARRAIAIETQPLQCSGMGNELAPAGRRVGGVQGKARAANLRTQEHRESGRGSFPTQFQYAGRLAAVDESCFTLHPCP